jgi:Ca-activated chloride channel family protein
MRIPIITSIILLLLFACQHDRQITEKPDKEKEIPETVNEDKDTGPQPEIKAEVRMEKNSDKNRTTAPATNPSPLKFKGNTGAQSLQGSSVVMDDAILEQEASGSLGSAAGAGKAASQKRVRKGGLSKNPGYAGDLKLQHRPDHHQPQDFNTEEYSRITENPFLQTLEHPMSTFAADVDAASYANARRFIVSNQLPYPDAVRTEEFINYFNYDYNYPDSDHPLAINLEYGECPWNSSNKLIHVGLQGKALRNAEKKASNLVFLLDVSGSMNSPNKLPLLKKAFKMLVGQLDQQDRIAIVVYAGSAGLVLPSTPGSKKGRILNALDKLQAGGSTAGGAGIQLAYQVAKDNFIKAGNNRVILATDGDFNIGVSSSSELVRMIEGKRDDGIFLTVLGFGMGNYKDDRLQELADRGNGTHAYIDNILEAKKVLVTEINATLYTIAKDVKIQVEFNPVKVKSYRLLGYENRMLRNQDFRDDKKDAGEMGAGHTVTAIYEIVPNNDDNTLAKDELKYQTTKIKDSAINSKDVMTLRIRYKQPDGDESTEFSKVLAGDPEDLDDTSNNFRFSAAVAQFAMILRKSETIGKSSPADVLKLATAATGKDAYGYRAEFINLVRRVDALMLDQENGLGYNATQKSR